MGKDTSVICNHNLNISSLKDLALDLSNRLQATIIYGYKEDFCINSENTLETLYQHQTLGEISCKASDVTYYLYDLYLAKKEFLKNHKQEVFDQKNINLSSFSIKDLAEIDSEIGFELNYNLEDNLICISEKLIEIWELDSLSWRFYQNFFVYNIQEENLEVIQNFRLNILEQIRLYGGDFAFVFCIEDDSYLIQELLEKQNLEEIIHKVNEKFDGLLVNIPNHFKHKTYLNKPFYEQKLLTKEYLNKVMFAQIKNIDFNPIEVKYPTLFYDDFKDLDPNLNKKNYFNLVYDSIEVLEKQAEKDDFHTRFEIKRETRDLPNLSQHFKLFSCFVSGFKHYTDSEIIINLIQNQEVFLLREPDNPHDKHAIALFLDHKNKKEVERIKVGYIGRHENYILSKLLDNKYSFKAFLTEIKEEDLERGNYNYALNMTIFMKKQ